MTTIEVAHIAIVPYSELVDAAADGRTVLSLCGVSRVPVVPMPDDVPICRSCWRVQRAIA